MSPRASPPRRTPACSSCRPPRTTSSPTRPRSSRCCVGRWTAPCVRSSRCAPPRPAPIRWPRARRSPSPRVPVTSTSRDRCGPSPAGNRRWRSTFTSRCPTRTRPCVRSTACAPTCPSCSRSRQTRPTGAPPTLASPLCERRSSPCSPGSGSPAISAATTRMSTQSRRYYAPARYPSRASCGGTRAYGRVSAPSRSASSTPSREFRTPRRCRATIPTTPRHAWLRTSPPSSTASANRCASWDGRAAGHGAWARRSRATP